MSEFSGQILGSLTQVLGLAEGATGGALSALLAQLENAGLMERVRSWVGHGDNLPVTAAELGEAFTPEQLNGWAEKAGTTPDALLQVMADELPHVVDRATPAPGAAVAAATERP